VTNHEFSMERMRRLTFVRHGQSVANAGGVTMEHALIPLSPLGEAQAACVADLLPAEPSRVLVSPYIRARDTARPYCLRVGREAEVQPLLQEFSAIDPGLLEGMTGVERRPIADAYWQAADPVVRMGVNADTFLEFDSRVRSFILELPGLPDNSIVFGHGIWFALLWWRLRGFRVEDSNGMRAFTDFRRQLPMPNCAVYALERTALGPWNVTADTRVIRAVAAI
jgi:broad specificity phosphatase PhoE